MSLLFAAMQLFRSSLSRPLHWDRVSLLFAAMQLPRSSLPRPLRWDRVSLLFAAMQLPRSSLSRPLRWDRVSLLFAAMQLSRSSLPRPMRWDRVLLRTSPSDYTTWVSKALLPEITSHTTSRLPVIDAHGIVATFGHTTNLFAESALTTPTLQPTPPPVAAPLPPPSSPTLQPLPPLQSPTPIPSPPPPQPRFRVAPCGAEAAHRGARPLLTVFFSRFICGTHTPFHGSFKKHENHIGDSPRRAGGGAQGRLSSQQ